MRNLSTMNRTHTHGHICALMYDTYACVQSQVYTCNPPAHPNLHTHTHESPLMHTCIQQTWTQTCMYSAQNTHMPTYNMQCDMHFHIKPAPAYTFRPWDCIGTKGSRRPNSTMSASCCVYTLRLRYLSPPPHAGSKCRGHPGGWPPPGT